MVIIFFTHPTKMPYSKGNFLSGVPRLSPCRPMTSSLPSHEVLSAVPDIIFCLGKNLFIIKYKINAGYKLIVPCLDFKNDKVKENRMSGLLFNTPERSRQLPIRLQKFL